MKLLSLSGSGMPYIECQFKLFTETVHFQSTETIFGWEERKYGSTCDLFVCEAVKEELREIIKDKYGIGALSLTDSGGRYICASIRRNGVNWKIQVYSPNYPGNNGSTGKYFKFTAYDNK